MKVRKATFTEVNQIRKWLKDTANWLKEKNSSMGKVFRR